MHSYDVLDSSTGFTDPIFQVRGVLCHHQEMFLGPENKWGRGLSGFHFYQAQIVTFQIFPSETEFNGSIKRIRFLFSNAYIFFLREFLAIFLENKCFEK